MTGADPVGGFRAAGRQAARLSAMLVAVSLAVACSTPSEAPSQTRLLARSTPPPAQAATTLAPGHPPTEQPTPAARNAQSGFNGKDCVMVSPLLPADVRKRARPGTVRARAHFVQGAVTQVTVLSGPRVYRQPVIAAMTQYTCKGSLTFAADQTFVFAFPPKLPMATTAGAAAR
jgi:hypothetical protein